MLLEARNISMAYGATTIIDDCSLSLDSQQSLALTGSSGVGKSTLLSILGLLLPPTKGTILIDGEDAAQLTDDGKSRIRNEKFGFVFQSTQLISSLTALENVLVPALLAGYADKSGRAEELLSSMGLEERMYHYPHQLSIGQQRRVSIARALLLEPSIVFADEPTNDLDEDNASAVGDILYGLPSAGCSLLIVTHDRSLAQRADRVYQVRSDGLTSLSEQAV